MHAARAIAEALFPPGSAFRLDGPRARVAEALDEHLARMPARERRLVRAGIRAIEYGSVLAGGSRFSRLPLGDRIEALRAEQDSDSRVRSLAFMGLKGIFGLLYFEMDEVLAELGWTLGCTPTAPP